MAEIVEFPRRGTEAQRRLVEGFRRLMPRYRFALSYFGKDRRSSETISDSASESVSEPPPASRSDKTE